MPEIGSVIALISTALGAIQNVKVYKENCEELGDRCRNLLFEFRDNPRDLQSDEMARFIDELGFIIERIARKMEEWGTWSHIRCLVQQRDVRDGLQRLNRELEGCMTKFHIQSSLHAQRSQQDLKAIHERDNSEILRLFCEVLTSQEDMARLLSSKPPVVEGVMEDLQTRLAAGLKPAEESKFKAGLWKIHKETSKLPPLTDLSGQITFLPSNPILGSSNVIYEGRWLDEEKVALHCPKGLENNPATRNRFERDASRWRKLHHTNVVRLYGTFCIGRKLYSVTPWMDNGNVSTYLCRFRSADRMKFLYETACGLEYLHDKEIVHGDLRAHHIQISQDGTACLSDFGLSEFFEDCVQNDIPSMNDSLRWTAPEVFRSGGSACKQSDVWSFGMVCYEILTSQFPFYRKEGKGLEDQVRHGKHPDRLDSIPDEMWNLMLRCWSQKAEDRPIMSVVKTALENIKSHPPVDPHFDETASLRSRESGPPSRKPMLKRLSVFFGNRTNTDQASATSKASPIRYEQTNGHDLGREQMAHIYSKSAPIKPSAAWSFERQTSHQSLHQPGWGPSSMVDSPTRNSRPSTANSTLRTPLPNIDEDELLESPKVSRTARSHSIPGQDSSAGGMPSPSELFPQHGVSDFSGSRNTRHDHSRPQNGRLTFEPSTESNRTKREVRPLRSSSSDAPEFSPISMKPFSSPTQTFKDNPLLSRSLPPKWSGSLGSNNLPHGVPERQTLNSSVHIPSGPLEGLVEFLIHGFNSSRYLEYPDAFLMACVEYTTPDELFQELEKRFRDQETNSRDAENRVVTQYSILKIIFYWIKGEYLTPDLGLLYRIKFFCEYILDLKPMGTLHDKAYDLHDVVSSEIEIQRRAIPADFDLGRPLQSSQVKPRDLAIGLSLLEGDNYAALHPSDYIMYLTDRQSVKLKNLYETNDKIKVWVTKSVLHFKEVRDRVDVLIFFINAATECLTMRNFLSATAIAGALHSTAVENLKVTRRNLKQNMQDKLSDLYNLINPESEHYGYRKARDTVTDGQREGTCIPWMAYHLRELDKILITYPAGSQENGQHPINSNRYIKFIERTKEIMFYVPPRLEEYRRQGQLAYIREQLRNINTSKRTVEDLVARSEFLMKQEASEVRKIQLGKSGFVVSS